MGYIAQGYDLTGRLIFLIIKYGAVGNDVENPAVLGEPSGFKTEDLFFGGEPLHFPNGLFFFLIRHKGNFFAH